ncbi:YaaR family protein [Mesobacillus maritimus]|uniref:YaaR family protein n=1 Tax=Mesobacillus maritimus TaxID=1643336 RepID=UPI00384CD5F8
MRIERQTSFPVGQLQKGPVESKPASSFFRMMSQSQTKLQLEQTLGRLEKQGQLLVQHRTIENLRDYKKIVQEFIGEVMNGGLQLSEKQSQHPNGHMKTHQLVEIVDQKLLELQDEVMNNEKHGLEVLGLIGEIKGLLINLYM